MLVIGDEEVSFAIERNIVVATFFCLGRSGSTWMRALLADMLPSRAWEEPKVGQLFGWFHEKASGVSAPPSPLS